MTRTAPATDPATTAAPPALVAGLRVVATLSVLFIVLQGLSAGLLLSRTASAGALHSAGAIVVHVLTGLTVVAVVLVARPARGPWWPAVLAAVVFVVGFLQALVGDLGILSVHVPLAMLLLVAAVSVMVWSFGRRA